jgi:polysaccharide biosynthesis protein PslE
MAANNLNPSISVKQLVNAVRNHRALAVAVFAGMIGLVVFLFVVQPRKYGSEGKLFVQIGRASQHMSAGGEPSPSISIQDSRETEIRSVAELIRSNDLLGEIVDEVGAESILASEFSLLSLPGLSSVFGGSEVDGQSGMTPDEYRKHELRENAIRHLDKNLTVSSEKKTSVISVWVLAANPLLAQRIATLIMEKVQKKHLQIHSAGRSRDFFEREFKLQREVLKKAEESLATFRTENGFLTIEQARETLAGVIDKLENQKVDIQVELSQSQSRVQELRNRAGAVSRELEMPTSGLESQSTEGAQTLLYARMAEKERLVAKYSPEHPRIQEIEKEIDNLEEQVKSLPKVRQEMARLQNPVYEELFVALSLEEATAESLKSRLAQVETRYEDARKRLAELNRIELESAEKQRDVQVAQQYFEVYAKRRGEAMVGDQLDKNSISDVVIAQAASLVLRKQSPRGSVLLPVGFIAALFAGLFAALLADRKNLTGAYSTEEIEAVLDLPVMATIPRIHSSRVHSN